MDSILLSICIPIFNDARKINNALDCVVEAVGERNDIDVIISDSASTVFFLSNMNPITNDI